MSDASERLVFKRGQTTRHLALSEGAAGADNLTGKTLRVKAVAGDTDLTLTSGLDVQSGATLGRFWYEATAADLASLGNPGLVTLYITMSNPDNTIFKDVDPFVVHVSW